jgi:hypothetical protein
LAVSGLLGPGPVFGKGGPGPIGLAAV